MKTQPAPITALEPFIGKHRVTQGRTLHGTGQRGNGLMRIAVLLTCTCWLLSAGQAIADVAARCEFGAFVTETDPAGLNVRSGPSLAAKVVGRLPPMFPNPELNGYLVKVEVDVLSSRSGWFEIANAQDNEALTDRPARRTFHGTGWVSGRKLSVKSQARKGYARPDRKSPVVFSLADGKSFDSDVFVEAGQLVACSGKWALVEFDRSKISADDIQSLKVEPVAQVGVSQGRFRAWISRICNIQETTCSGLGGDEPQPPR